MNTVKVSKSAADLHYARSWPLQPPMASPQTARADDKPDLQKIHHPDVWIRVEHKDLFPVGGGKESFPHLHIEIRGHDFVDDGDRAILAYRPEFVLPPIRIRSLDRGFSFAVLIVITRCIGVNRKSA